MLFHGSENMIPVGHTHMDYVTFGTGEKNLVIIPGLSIRRMKGTAVALAKMYQIFAKEYKVFVIDRKNDVPEAYTVREMAQDISFGMDALHIREADVIGISQGGMVAQYLAIDFPQKVHKLVLGVTLSQTNETMQAAIDCWTNLAAQNDFSGILQDMLTRMYSEKYREKYGKLFPLLARMVKLNEPERFIRLAKACLTCDSYRELDKIQCPVFVIGGNKDQVVSGQASEEISAKLGCELFMYEELGHSAYEEAKDFNKKIFEFLQK